MSDFLTIAFQSSLSTNAILFGVFGFLYSVFASYSNVVAPNGSAKRSPLARALRMVCRILAVFILFNAALTFYALYLIYLGGALSNLNMFILALGLAL